jgi:hypothetical protein
VLIGLNGKKQAGKDTAYLRLAHLFGGELVERRSFADRLYRSAASALGVTVEELQEWKSDPEIQVCVRAVRDLRDGEGLPFKHHTVIARASVREYLQRYGTEAHRDVFGDSFWVEQVDLEHAGRMLVVTDVRFPNEAERIRAAGGWVVVIRGPADVERAGDDHASEAPLPAELVDATISNDIRDDGYRHLDGQLRTLVRLASGNRQPRWC